MLLQKFALRFTLLLLLFGIVGGSLHVHESAVSADACVLCHASTEQPAARVATSLFRPAPTSEFVAGATIAAVPVTAHYVHLAPRAPPSVDLFAA